MLEIESTKWDLVNTIVFSLVDADLLDYDNSTSDIDKAHDVIMESLKDVVKVEMVRRIIIENDYE